MMSMVGCAGNTAKTNVDGCLEMVNSPSTTLDNVWYNPGGIFRCAVFESLLNTNADMSEMQGALAESYTVSEDGLCYSFQLRHNVKWHDGEKFDAEDVVFSVKTALRTGEINGMLMSAFQYIEGAPAYSAGESDELPGLTAEGQTVTFRLYSAVGAFLDAIAQFAILPEHILGEVLPEKLAEDEYWKKPVGCGCYAVTEAVEGEYFLLEANKEYYGKKAGIAKIRIRTNVENYVEEMRSGDLDFYVTNDPEEIAELKGIGSCSEHSLKTLFPTYLIMNLSEDEGVNEDLKDVRVRKALLLAIDRENLTEVLFPGSLVNDTLVPSWDAWYNAEGEDFSYNPEEAKRLLKEAEFDFSKTLRLRYSVKGQATADLMNAIAVYWREVAFGRGSKI